MRPVIGLCVDLHPDYLAQPEAHHVIHDGTEGKPMPPGRGLKLGKPFRCRGDKSLGIALRVLGPSNLAAVENVRGQFEPGGPGDLGDIAICKRCRQSQGSDAGGGRILR